MDYCKEVGYREMAEETEKLKKECAVEVFSIGKSVRGREISCLSLGSGRKSVLFVGVHHGMERITAALALKFARDIAEGTIWGDETAKVLSKRRIYIIPMLNPDGAEIALGRTDENERYMLSRMRGGDELAHWQANARGVDLNHNYNAGFDLCREEERRMGIFTAGNMPRANPKRTRSAISRGVYRQDCAPPSLCIRRARRYITITAEKLPREGKRSHA